LPGKVLSRRPDRSERPFSWPVFALASLAADEILVTLVAVPQWLSQQARWEQLRKDVGAIGQMAASAVDGDLHRRLIDPKNYSDDLYKRALAPLVRLHSADPDIFYLYTMVDRGGVAHFIPVLPTCAASTTCAPPPMTRHLYRAKTMTGSRSSLRHRLCPMHRNADSALHQARAEGRNRICVFEPPGEAEREPAPLAKATA
jgi:hypothetical protein